MTAAEVAEEIRFLIRAGEGTHRILTAIGYSEAPRTLMQRLKRNGYAELNDQLFGEKEAA